MRKTMVESITNSLKELNKDGFVDDSAMTDIESLSFSDPSHPGEILKELVLEPLSLTIETAAHHLGVKRQVLFGIIDGSESVSPEMALRLELAFGNVSAEHWLSMQNAWDLCKVKKRIGELKVIPFKPMK